MSIPSNNFHANVLGISSTMRDTCFTNEMGNVVQNKHYQYHSLQDKTYRELCFSKVCLPPFQAPWFVPNFLMILFITM